MKEQVYRYEQLKLYVRDNQRGGGFKLKGTRRLFVDYLAEVEKFIKAKHTVITKYENLNVSLMFCGTQLIRKLNRLYRSKDKPTDVLSFPVYDNLRIPGEFIPPSIDLGDIFICRDVAIKQAQEYGVTIETEILRQLIHGTLHLFGYDHEINADEEKIMFQHEEEIYSNILKK